MHPGERRRSSTIHFSICALMLPSTFRHASLGCGSARDCTLCAISCTTASVSTALYRFRFAPPSPDVAAHRLAIDARPARYRLDALLGLPASQHFSHVSHARSAPGTCDPSRRRPAPSSKRTVHHFTGRSLGSLQFENWGSLEPENPNHTPACGGPLCLQIVGSHEPENFPLMRSHHAAKRHATVAHYV